LKSLEARFSGYGPNKNEWISTNVMTAATIYRIEKAVYTYGDALQKSATALEASRDRGARR